MVSAIANEARVRADELSGQSFETIYFGGGTPTTLNPLQLDEILNAIHASYNVVPNPELTIESNPDNLSREYLDQIRSLGFNRLSIGLQSFHNRDLAFMHRSHREADNIRAVKSAQDAGFDNISVDLIYGIPWHSKADWQHNLDQIGKLQVQHLSAYALTVEPKTELDIIVNKKKLLAMDEDKSAQHFLQLRSWARAQGIFPYEISNFACPGFHSRHNSAYWTGIPYLGLGPSAHSFDGKTCRSWNISNNAKYLAEAAGTRKSEQLGSTDLYNEYIMTGLRRSEGISLEEITQRFGITFHDFFKNESVLLLKDGRLVHSDRERIIIPEAHLFQADGIASALFMI